MLITLIMLITNVRGQTATTTEGPPTCKHNCTSESVMKVIIQSSDATGRSNVKACSMSATAAEELNVHIGDDFYMHSISICPDDRVELQKMEGILQVEDDKVVNALEHALIDA